MGLFTNPGVGQANAAYGQAFNTAGMLGGEAQGINANLTPFLTQEMLHPQGYGQQGISAMNAAASGGEAGHCRPLRAAQPNVLVPCTTPERSVRLWTTPAVTP